MTVLGSMVLFVIAAFAEIGGAWLVWQGVREHRGLLWIGAGVPALGAYGFVATLAARRPLRPDPGRLRRIFVAGSPAWGMIVDGFRPDRFDVIGSVICLVGVGVMDAPRVTT